MYTIGITLAVDDYITRRWCNNNDNCRCQLNVNLIQHPVACL